MASDRLKKVNDLIRDEVGKVLSTELDLDGVLVTVTKASVSPTLEHATVFISVLPADRFESVLGKINKQIYSIQQSLNRVIAFRPVPKLRFASDDTNEHIERIEMLLDDDINKE